MLFPWAWGHICCICVENYFSLLSALVVPTTTLISEIDILYVHIQKNEHIKKNEHLTK